MPKSIRSTTAARAAVFAPIGGAGRAELVEQRLIDAIVLGHLSHGERLPSESQMAKQFGVATVTAREALESLRTKGLVETRRGRDGGSFVTSRGSQAASIEARVSGLSRVGSPTAIPQALTGTVLIVILALVLDGILAVIGRLTTSRGIRD